MKSKILKPMAVATIMAMGLGTTALAATVKTTTDYEFDASGDPSVTVTTNIGAAAPSSQVTFLVANGKVTDGSNIVYIDQAGVDSEGNAKFVFKVAQSKLYANTTVTAKFGTDGTYGSELKSFGFYDGVDYFTNGTAAIENVTDITLDSSDTSKTYIVYGKITGAVKEYGLKLTKDSEEAKFPAYATEDGVFVVTVDAGTSDYASGWTASVYAIDANDVELAPAVDSTESE